MKGPTKCPLQDPTKYPCKTSKLMWGNEKNPYFFINLKGPTKCPLQDPTKCPCKTSKLMWGNVK